MTRFRLTLPHSEVNMHMRVAGRTFDVEPLASGMAQLWDPETGEKFSFPITMGEAGLSGVEVTNVPLVGWDTFAELAPSIRAKIFGEMVARARSVINEYHSDLYYDALWLAEWLVGPDEFEWLVRPSGTNIFDSARIGVEIGAGATAQFYRVRVFRARSMNLTDDRPLPDDGSGYWHAEFTRVPLHLVAHLAPIPQGTPAA
jgi:hypothetical protein